MTKKQENKNTQKIKNIIVFSMAIIIASLIVPVVSATLVLDRIQYDPAIITAGDEVDIIIYYHEDSTTDNDNKIGNPEYNFKTCRSGSITLTSSKSHFLTFLRYHKRSLIWHLIHFLKHGLQE